MNRTNTRTVTAAIGLALAMVAHPAASQSFSSGSTGTDGPVTFAGQNNFITVKAGGVYNYTTYTVTGVVKYFRNTDNAPLVILATGDITIDTGAVLDVSGTDALPPNWTTQAPQAGSQGGPGGFAGGNGGFNGNGIPSAAVPPTAGKGPGGGAPGTNITSGQGGAYAAPASFIGLTPLFGGSGGGGGSSTGSFAAATGGPGAGGGGAVLIASSTRIIIRGQIKANGGFTQQNNGVGCQGHGAAGTGGAIRLVAPQIIGGGNVQAIRGISASACSGTTAPGDGKIRLEAFNIQSTFTGTTNPIASIVNTPGPVSPAGNPALVNVPTLTIASVAKTPVPLAQPQASYFAPDMTLPAGTTSPVEVVVNATNTPVDAATAITVRVIPQSPGTATSVAATNHTGSFSSSSATASVTLPAGQVTVLQAHAAMTLTGQTASLFPLIDGEPVEHVAVAATPGQPSTLSLVTKSGKERRLDEMPLEDQIRVARAWEAMKATRTE